MTIRAESGTTLVEVLIATLVLVSGLMAMAQLCLAAAAVNAAARGTTVTTTLAAQKVEQLLAGDATVGAEGVEHVDAFGNVVGSGESPPDEAVYTRRWRVAAGPDTVAIDVRVGRSDRARPTGPMRGETRVAAIRRMRR